MTIYIIFSFKLKIKIMGVIVNIIVFVICLEYV